MAKTFLCSKDAPVVQTAAGKLRGYQFDGTYVFKGVHYATAKRFMMPEKVQPWEGVKDALIWGHTAPVPSDFMIFDDFTVPHRFWPQGEDCQCLNIWTQSLTGKKPVMVWIHGGGFYNGSSMEMIAYEGENLSKYGDVVVVTVNHRLNHLGYFDLSSFGEKYWNSGNCGMADLVAALEWIRDNIAAFGGDPDNVTLFGQSGGGGKITTLLQTPAADGLFHKAVIQSGVLTIMEEKAERNDRAVAEKMMEILGVKDVAALETAPLDALQRAYVAAVKALNGGKFLPMGGAPVANGWYVGDPKEVGFRDHALTVPTVVGTVIAEMGCPEPLPARDEMSDAEVRKVLAGEYGAANVDETIRLFTEAYPDKAPIYAMYVDDRTPALDFCRERAKGSAPVYNYVFGLTFPFDGGTPAWHCAEIPFVFHNAEMFPLYHIPGVTEQLQEKMSGAWVSFARTGKPAADWEAVTPEQDATYVFDEKSEMRYGYDRALMEFIGKHRKVHMFAFPSAD